MRRSSRQQPPPPPTGGSSTSGPSSTASARLERSTRSHNKQASPQKSATPQSALSSENNDAEDGAAPLARRSKRGQQDMNRAGEDQVVKPEDDDGEDDQGEEEEVTRCLCGQAEYPGPPEVRSKSNHPALDAHSDDAGGMFIQCDVCKVWQHGGCVGIMDEAASPDDYFCERCRPEYHEVSTAKNGQKYSLYLPVHEKLNAKALHRKSSSSREADVKAAREKEKAIRAEALAKRRSTMNSRSAYDEEEVLRAVLEESKNEGGPASDNGARKGKRGRDDSEDTSKDPKRQKTASDISSDNDDNQSQAGESDNENKATKQKPRGAAARSQREKEQKEKERDRIEAVNKRKGRAERRRGEDSEPPDNTARPSTAPSDVDGSASQPPDTPQLGPTSLKGTKKGGKLPNKRGKNQWTRDNTQTPMEADGLAANGDRRSRRGAVEDTSPPRNARSGDNTDGNGSGKEPAEPDSSAHPIPIPLKGHGRAKGPRQMNVHKTSMNEMRRRVNTMLQAVSQAQVDMAGKKSYQVAIHSALNGTNEMDPHTKPKTEPTKEAEKENRRDQQQTGGSASNSSSSTRGFAIPFEEFERLPHTEQANLLSTQLVLWQQEFGKVGEK